MIEKALPAALHAAIPALAMAAAMLASLTCVTSITRAQGGNSRRVEYVVRLDSPQTQRISMSMILRGVPAGELEVCLPVWRPGRYQILDMAGTVSGVSARAGDGRDRAIRKVEKSTWKVGVESGDDEIIIDYLVYANSLGDRTRHVDDSHAFLSPAAVFMYAPSMRGEPLTVRMAMPVGWSIATGLEADLSDQSAVLAPDYDTLVDSPIEAGYHDVVDFDVDGTPHQIVVWWGGVAPDAEPSSRGRFFDKAGLAEDFAKIIRVQRDIFGGFPYKRYVFLVHCYQGGGGGTEHLNSTVVGCSPSAFEDEGRYHAFLRLISHEYFHTWNVKQLRPKGLKPYDYQRENYTDLLWVAEGATSYYQNVALVRTGQASVDEFLGSVGGLIDSDRGRIGASEQSAEESSFDAWIKFNKPNPDAANSTVSFYDRGAQLSLAMDVLIRRESGGVRSMDDLMRALYERFPLDGPGYTSDDFKAMSSQVAGADISWFFERFVARPGAIEYERIMPTVGLEVYRTNAQATRTIGASVDDADGGAKVSAIRSGSPAERAGLLVGDVIVAIDDRRVRGGEFFSRLQEFASGVTTEITLFRMNVLRHLRVTIDESPGGSWRVRRVESPTPEQKRNFEAWTGQRWGG